MQRISPRLLNSSASGQRLMLLRLLTNWPLLCVCMVLIVLSGCKEWEVEGTWKFSSVEGASSDESASINNKLTGSELISSSDKTFKFTISGDVERGTWKISEDKKQVLLTLEEENAKPVPSSTDSLQIVGSELIIKREGASVVFKKVSR